MSDSETDSELTPIRHRTHIVPMVVDEHPGGRISSSRGSSVSGDPSVHHLQSALRQAQISASGARAQEQRGIRSGSTASVQPPPRAPRRSANDDELRDAALKVAIFCVPWITWKTSGPWVVAKKTPPRAITGNDSLGEDVLYYISPSVRAEFLTSDGQTKVRDSMKTFRSTAVNHLRGKGTLIFGSEFDGKWFQTGYNRAGVEEFRRLLGVDSPGSRQYALFPRIFYPNDDKKAKDIFLNPALLKILKAVLFGPSSLDEVPSKSGRKPLGTRWKIREVTPGAIALAAILARFFLSPDSDFCEMGNTSGINYLEAFQVYKSVLSKDPNASIWQRIFSEYNTYLFGTESTFSNDPDFNDGDLAPELEEFMNKLQEEDAAGDATGTSSLPLSSTPTPLVSADSPPPSPPVSSIQSEHRISISFSAASNTSHTITVASSSKVISSGPAPPSPELTVGEPSPPTNPGPTRPVPKKKKQQRDPSMSTSDADLAPAPRRGNRTTTSEPSPPTHTLRSGRS